MASKKDDRDGANGERARAKQSVSFIPLGVGTSAPLFELRVGAHAVRVPMNFAAGLPGLWSTVQHRSIWRRLLPEEAYRGAFTTAHGCYLYGEREGQFSALAEGGVCEALPNDEYASEIMAIHLSQQPRAKRILVLGPNGLAISRRFCQLPGIERVTWLHPDPAFPQALVAVLPEAYKERSGKLKIPVIDARDYLRNSDAPYDIVILNLPDLTSLALNRYATTTFFNLLKPALSPEGLVSMRISGAENYLGDELVYLGASALRTLRSNFARVTLKPGAETWLIASDGADLSAYPAELRDRYEGVNGAAERYPPEGLFSLYPPDRIAFQNEKYQHALKVIDQEMLINTDAQPKALLYHLALALRKAGWKNVAEKIPVLLHASGWILGAALLLFTLLRVFFVLSRRPFTRKSQEEPSQADPRMPSYCRFEAGFLVFSTGLAGMALNVILMYLFQSRYGSLFLWVGLISSCFMLGLFVGGRAAERIIEKAKREPRWLMPSSIGLHGVGILGLIAMPLDSAQVLYALLFLLGGLFTGVYFPIASHRFKATGLNEAASGALLESLDHLGGAWGALLISLVMLPLLGATSSLGWLALLVGINMIFHCIPKRQPAPATERDRYETWRRPLAYALFGVTAFLLLASWLVSEANAKSEGRKPIEAAGQYADAAHLQEREKRLATGPTMPYFEVADEHGMIAGYVFSSGPFARDIVGYGGPIELAIHVSADGNLLGYALLASHETPVYLQRLEAWHAQLTGRNIFEASPFKDVDAVSGATMSSDAIKHTLQRSGQRFAGEVLGRKGASPLEDAEVNQAGGWIPSRAFLCISLLILLALALRYRPGPWRRRAFLFLSLAGAGLWLNVQYASTHVFALLGGTWPEAGLSVSCLLVLMIPIVVLLFGNVFCGYVCPFGALQELVGELRGRRGLVDPDKRIWRYGRAVKYVLLAFLGVLFALTRDPGVLMVDPLVTFFSGLSDQTGFWLGVSAVIASFFFRRFWCRNLCPSGAFLALLNRVKLGGRVLPRVQPRRCDLGVRTHEELDCLCCDRCRNEED